MTAVLAEEGLPARYQLGVQTFQGATGHVAPVLYDAQSKKLYDLQAGGEPTADIRNAVYDVTEILNAELHRKAKKGVESSELILVQGRSVPTDDEEKQSKAQRETTGRKSVIPF